MDTVMLLRPIAPVCNASLPG